MEKEIEALETEELNICANEEVVLKRLKEVERTAEDIIKVGAKKHRERSSPAPVKAVLRPLAGVSWGGPSPPPPSLLIWMAIFSIACFLT